jgi:tRNA(fMet)-specific endonuclease VapC
MTPPKTLIDTDILSLVFRNDPRVASAARDYVAAHATFTISLITRFEILRGLIASQATTRRDRFQAFCTKLEVLPIEDRVIDRAAEIYARLYQTGQLIPDADVLIAATALEYQLVLATKNLSDFQRVPGLMIDRWLA